MQHVDVEVDDVELVPPPMQIAQHRQMRRQIGFESARVETNRLVAADHELCLGARFATREQGHVEPEIDQRVGQVSDDPLGTTIKSGRHGLVQGCHLRNPQARAAVDDPIALD